MKKTLYYLVLFACILSTVSCVRKDPVTPEPGNGNECDHKGIIKEHNDPANNCFVRLIEMSDGSLLEPIDQKELYAHGISPGQEVSFSHEVSNYRGINCTPAIPVKLTCLKPLGCSNRDLAACAPLTLLNGPLDKSNITINNAVLTGNCLELDISFGGCCGNTEDIQLQWDGELKPNYPTTAYLSVIHTRPTACKALVTKKISFDVSSLKKGPSSYLHIYVSGWNEKIEYQ